ncbi:MAG: serine hydrolase [Halolamina sp.]|uniref:serine hydrolase n=1 Tax=Halolamina sp. TaxID=1940283 RepID=UPI002FC28426
MASLTDETIHQLEQFLGDWLTDATVPGASIAVVRDGDIAYTGGFGSRELTENSPATPETLYGVASCTKSFTALSIQLLAERGKLRVDDPLSAHLDGIRIEGEDGPITLHDLLTHSSGLPSLGTSTVLLYRLTGVEEYGVPLGDREDFHRHLNGAADEIAGPRGERFMYCNSGYNLLGEVVEELSGTPFDEFVESEILQPLGMERSGMDPAALKEGDAMTPHALKDGGAEATPYPYRPVSLPAGGLIAPVTELTRYLRMQQNGGTFEGTELIAEESLAQAHAGHMERADSEYGYGWQRTDVVGRTLVGHGGSLGVSSSYMGFTEDGEWAIAIGANTTPSPTPPTVAKGVLAILAGEDPEEAVPFFARKSRFEKLTGEYESYRGITTATVEREAGALRLTSESALGEETLTLLPADPENPGDEFDIPTMAGAKKTATFEEHGDHVDLYYDRNRLHKQR